MLLPPGSVNRSELFLFSDQKTDAPGPVDKYVDCKIRPIGRTDWKGGWWSRNNRFAEQSITVLFMNQTILCPSDRVEGGLLPECHKAGHQLSRIC